MQQIFSFFRMIVLLGMTMVVVGQDQLNVVAVNCSEDGYIHKIERFVPESFFLNSVTYHVDFTFDKKDLSYITSLKEGDDISRGDLLGAIFYLQQKGRFPKIELRIIKKESGYALDFNLTGNVLLSKVSLLGYIRGKEYYKNAYLLDVGEPFNEQKHEHSLEKMKDLFYEQGYFNTEIIDHLNYNNNDKTVAVQLAISKGRHFHIKKVDVKLKAVGAIYKDQLFKIKQKLLQLASSMLERKGYSYTSVKKVKEQIKILLAKKGYVNFEISIDRSINKVNRFVDLLFSVAIERKKEFIFIGNNYFTKQELLDHLMLYGKSSWHFPTSIITDEIKQLYKSRGFWDAEISVHEEKGKMFCSIKERDRVRICGVQFKDNDYIASSILQKEMGRLFRKEKHFDRELLRRAEERIINLYKQVGFWDVKIAKEEFIPFKKQHCYIISLTLDEGRCRTIGECVIDGYPDLENQGPFVRMKKEKNKGFDTAILLEQKQWLLRYFRNRGYLKVAVNYQLVDNRSSIDVKWLISLEDQAARFGKTMVLGSSVVPTSYIMREISYNQGDEWDKAKLETTLKRLQSFGVFETVQLYPGKEVDEKKHRPLFLKLVDDDRFELRTRFGLQQVGRNLRFHRGFSYKFGGDFLYRNPFHYGDMFSINADLTRYYRSVNASYQFPWLLAAPVRCQYKVYDTMYNHPVYIGSKLALYKATQQGFLWNMTRAFDYVTISGTTGLEWMGIKEGDQPRLDTIIDYDTSLVEVKTPYFYFEPNVIWQKLDNIINPHKGHFSFVSCKVMVDIKKISSFFKVVAEHSFYTPLSNRSVLAVRMRGGHIFNQSFYKLIPIERFYLGGANSIRGYERDYAPPLGMLTCPIKDDRAGLPKEAENVWRYAPQGGRTMINLNTEIRFPIYKDLGGVVFNDVGALFKDSLQKVLKDKSDNIIGGTGFGIRYNTPVGPLRFDFAVKWNCLFKSFESRYVWYLTLGQAF